MKIDRTIYNDRMKIFCSDDLYDFSCDFIEYYNSDINRIKKELDISYDFDILFGIFSDITLFSNLPYEVTDFSGFFTDTGVVAYVHEGGKYTTNDLFTRLMHEAVHYLYKNYVYGEHKERITWVDEGLAQFLSNQRSDLDDVEKFKLFLSSNLNDVNIDLNKLNHTDRSFGNSNGYNLSYIAIRYLYEANEHDEFMGIIKDRDKLLEFGNEVLENAKRYYERNVDSWKKL